MGRENGVDGSGLIPPCLPPLSGRQAGILPAHGGKTEADGPGETGRYGEGGADPPTLCMARADHSQRAAVINVPLART